MTRLGHLLSISTLLLSLPLSANPTEIPGTNGIPDLIKGGKLDRLTQRWVGPLGIYCGFHRPDARKKQKVENVCQLQILQIEEGSPADGTLQIFDVILGADGTGAAKVTPFKGSSYALNPIADAIAEAEARKPATLKLLVWRPDGDASKKKLKGKKEISEIDSPRTISKMLKPFKNGKMMTISVKLETLGRYSDTAPYNCEKSRNILRRGVKALYESNEPGKFYMGILSLMAANDPSNPGNDLYQARAKEWIYKMIEDKSLVDRAWSSGIKLIILSEYYLQTQDERVFPHLVEQAERHARGVSWFGTTGHRFADKQPDGSDGGRISGYGALSTSGAQGFLGLSLAIKAGVKSSVVLEANERQRIYFGHTAFRGGHHYGEMPWDIRVGSGDFNGKNAASALALGLQDEKGSIEKAKYFTQMAALSTAQSRRYAHAGPFFGQVWQPLGAALGGKESANIQFREIRRHLDLKRHWDHTRIFDPTDNKYKGFSYSASALPLYALPLKQLYVTGRGQKEALKFSEAEFKELKKSKEFDVSKASTEELMKELSRNHGMSRSTVSEELAERIKKAGDSPKAGQLIDQLLKKATDTKDTTAGRAGACAALLAFKAKDSKRGALKKTETAEAMVKLLKDPDPYLRFAGAHVLRNLNLDVRRESVLPHANAIMDAIIDAERPTFPLDKDDPCQWAHGEMGMLLFEGEMKRVSPKGKQDTRTFEGVLKNIPENIDRKKMVAALRSVLGTANSGARSKCRHFLTQLTKEDALALAPELVDNIMVPPPANAMGGSASQGAQQALALHAIEEGLPLSMIYGKEKQSALQVNIPQTYGDVAFEIGASKALMKALGELMLIDTTVDANEALKLFKESKGPKKLVSLKEIRSIKAANSKLKLPVHKTELTVDAINRAFSDPTKTTYTWRKVYGAGKVSFSPNNSHKAKSVNVVFKDKKPGRYRFEVIMTDSLGYTEASKTVDVILYNEKSQLPANRPPKALSQSLKTFSGLPTEVKLSGTDPDGDDLGFRVTKAPSHGQLSGAGGQLTYTPHFGFKGSDSLSFEAIDGQGETARGTVSFKVRNEGAEVAIYDGFDVSPGPINGRSGESSFGFAGPWSCSDGKKNYLASEGSLSYPSLPSKGGQLTKGMRHKTLTRTLDPKVLSAHKLLDDGHELWFSFFMTPPKKKNMEFTLDGPGLRFGLKAGGSKHKFETIFNDDKDVGKANNGYSSTLERRFTDGPNMIIGHCTWGKNADDPDRIRVYRVFDAPMFGPLVLDTPILEMDVIIPQQDINQVSFKEFEAGAIDEIRIGPTKYSVMAGTRPLNASNGTQR